MAIQEIREQEWSSDIPSGESGWLVYSYDLPEGVIPISANGEAHGMITGNILPMPPEDFDISTSFANPGSVSFYCWYRNSQAEAMEVMSMELYYSYLTAGP